jgi:hypothetical protein
MDSYINNDIAHNKIETDEKNNIEEGEKTTIEEGEKTTIEEDEKTTIEEDEKTTIEVNTTVENNDAYSETLFKTHKMGFIITRHVRDIQTNYYWNFAVQSIRKFYTHFPIVIIDDNSDYNFVRQFSEYHNVRIIASEFKGRGELLPYVYLLKHRFFDNALIMHDSVFIHKPINFLKVIKKGIKVLPIWYFNPDKENLEGRLRIASALNNSFLLKDDLQLTSVLMFGQQHKWYGCFGVQSFINTQFLSYIEQKYKITNLIGVITCRSDRQCLERIMGCIFSKEFKVKDKHGIRKSLLGDIMKYQQFGYSLENYISDLKTNNIKKSFIKVWTGR